MQIVGTVFKSTKTVKSCQRLAITATTLCLSIQARRQKKWHMKNISTTLTKARSLKLFSKADFAIDQIDTLRQTRRHNFYSAMNCLVIHVS